MSFPSSADFLPEHEERKIKQSGDYQHLENLLKKYSKFCEDCGKDIGYRRGKNLRFCEECATERIKKYDRDRKRNPAPTKTKTDFEKGLQAYDKEGQLIEPDHTRITKEEKQLRKRIAFECLSFLMYQKLRKLRRKIKRW